MILSIWPNTAGYTSLHLLRIQKEVLGVSGSIIYNKASKDYEYFYFSESQLFLLYKANFRNILSGVELEGLVKWFFVEDIKDYDTYLYWKNKIDKDAVANSGFWNDFLNSNTVSSAIGGAIGGAAIGSFTGPGAIVGGITGAVTGAIGGFIADMFGFFF